VFYICSNSTHPAKTPQGCTLGINFSPDTPYFEENQRSADGKSRNTDLCAPSKIDNERTATTRPYRIREKRPTPSINDRAASPSRNQRQQRKNLTQSSLKTVQNICLYKSWQSPFPLRNKKRIGIGDRTTSPMRRKASAPPGHPARVQTTRTHLRGYFF